MVAAKELTKKYTKDAKIIVITTSLSKLEKNKTYVLATIKEGGENINLTWTNTKGRDPKKSYVERLNNLESWRVNK